MTKTVGQQKATDSFIEIKRDKVTFRDSPDDVVTLTIGELDDLAYSAALRAAHKATNDLYHGLTKAFFYRWDNDIRALLGEMEQLKLRLDTKGDNVDD